MTKTRPFGVLVGIVAGYFAGWGLYHLLLTGSCSTPAGPGEVPCPPGTERYFFAIMFGMFGGIGSMFIGGGWVSFLALFTGIGMSGVIAGLRPAELGGQRWFLFFGACFLLTPALAILSLPFVGLKRLRVQRLLSDGLPGVGTLLSIEDTGVMINNNPRVRLTMRIELADGVRPPYEATKTATVSKVQIPRVGDRFPVWVDRDDPSTWMFATGTPDATAPPSLRRVVELARQGAAPAVPAPQMGQDIVAQLNTLNELRLTGKIGDEEFARRTAALINAAPMQ